MRLARRGLGGSACGGRSGACAVALPPPELRRGRGRVPVMSKPSSLITHSSSSSSSSSSKKKNNINNNIRINNLKLK